MPVNEPPGVARSRLDEAVSAEGTPVMFVPAYADRYCQHCGFPFRGKDRSRTFCHEYPKTPDHGACGEREVSARSLHGLMFRLQVTQDADPYATRTSKHAVAHGWVREHYADVDLQDWEPDGVLRSEVPEQARPGKVASLPAEAWESATDLLRRLLGIPLRTSSRGLLNVILEVSPPNVVVGTGQSPDGQLIPIAALEHALSLLRSDGSVMITPEAIGHRSSFLAAVLLTLPGATVTGSPPRLTITGPDNRSQTADAGDDADRSITFEGDLSRGRTREERQEQATLRQQLFQGKDTAKCALCGTEYPVRFLVAAHIKKRSRCTDAERRDLSSIAMAACLFGCDALFEFGYISVTDDGTITTAPGAADTIGDRLRALHGVSCLAHDSGSEGYFRWHRENVFRSGA